MSKLGYVPLAAVLLSLAACGGGSSGNRSLGGGAVPFDGFSNVQPNSTVQLQGIGRVAQYAPNARNTGIVLDPSQQVNVTSTATVDGTGTPTALSVQTDPANPFSGGATLGPAGTGASFDTASGDSFTDGTVALGADAAGFDVASTAGTDQIGIVANPVSQNFEYQTFGVWANGLDTNSGVMGAASLGVASLGVPTNGTANYSGTANGIYVDASGTEFYTFAGFTASANFDTNFLHVATSGTQAINANTLSASDMHSLLDFSGDGQPTQPFAVNIANGATPATLSGTLKGQFYGPAQQEIGGTFDMTGAPGHYMGAVGGKTP